ncbi:MAG TPA: MarP family serine protease, partial [Verrucomicrobiae bacterium]|nr:MarP family serine protease [Verrucomicrobiae bacterium]
MIIDLLIILFAISALYRGREIGFVRQLCSTVGFFGGLFLGALLEPHLVGLAHTAAGRSLVTLLTMLGCALVLLTIGEYIGIRLKHKVLLKRVNRLDNGLGAVLNIVSLLFSIWLTAAIIGALPFPSLQATLHSSRIVRGLDRLLPSAPTIIADLGHLIDPNGFPQVFIGSEPSPRSGINLPSLGELQAAVDKDKYSVVKVEGQGCGGIVEGSGFIVGNGLVATNAHVVAGIRSPYVEDSNGTHRAVPIWFDPNLDFAVLRVSNLAGHPLILASSQASSGTPGAVLGYPGGGPLSAGPAAVLDEFTASGRNIYGRGNTNREVYEVQATVIPGNS